MGGGVPIFLQTHLQCLVPVSTTCSHHIHSCCYKWEVSLQRKMSSINLFFLKKRIIDLAGQDLWWSSAVSDQCQQWPLTPGASSKLLRTAFHRSKRASAYWSLTMLALQSCSCHIALACLQVFICKRTFTLAFPIFGCQGCHNCSSSAATDELCDVTL